MVTSIKLFPYSSKFIRKDISSKSVPSKTTKNRIDQAAFVTVLLMAHMTIGVQLAGEGKVGLPFPFFKIEKSAMILEKKRNDVGKKYLVYVRAWLKFLI